MFIVIHGMYGYIYTHVKLGHRVDEAHTILTLAVYIINIIFTKIAWLLIHLVVFRSN